MKNHGTNDIDVHCNTSNHLQDGVPPDGTDSKQEQDPAIKERDSKDSLLRERASSKDLSRSPKDRVKSAKGDRAEKDKLNKGDSPPKSRSGSKLLIADKPKSGAGPPKSGSRKMSRMEKPGDLKGVF